VSATAERITIAVDAATSVSGLVVEPPGARAAIAIAHGAGAGMTHPFLAAVADGLAARGIASLRYQFAFMEQRSKRPDPPALAHAVVRAAVGEAARRWPGLKLIAGGKSFGGRMTSQAQAIAPLPDVGGIAFVGFPLHPAGKPADERARHLADVGVPMLFLQGTRDALADAALIAAVADRLAPRGTLRFFEDADHAFHVRASSGRTDAQTLAELLDALRDWIDALP
jgi:predicted alpha/beta-hydrolase family hydrolase